ncbi:right-handed parallel beta-helix repeat-containing protein [Tichowtungia aerotolerans]|uniref:Right handed beta helix domain-containing protein n=1 Tax=Tichowtungia aerotolerans TaxID=2697043 RepID=A0A6P1MA56_9BACT|nr:hypothetical protein [Tichowtungia aerotolerans]QHI69434.1 hypothetical protein GT409_08190 [Tichowtungia aerotolerans]
MEFDTRTFEGSGLNTFVGLFNDSGDNDDHPQLNWIGAVLSVGGVHGTTKNSSGYLASTPIALDGTGVLHRVKMKVYNTGEQTLMDVSLYRIDDETFEVEQINEIAGFVVLDEGESFVQGLDVFGVRNKINSEQIPPSYLSADLDNLYFSLETANKEQPVPSFAPLCVSAKLSTGSPYFDPWNTDRWSEWYSGTNLIKSFAVDCNVVLADRGGSTNRWKPSVSQLSSGRLFYLGNCSRGITFDGNGQYIDARLGKASSVTVQTLYEHYEEYSHSIRHPLTNCFYCVGIEEPTFDETIIRDLWVFGCIHAFRTGGISHPVTVDAVRFRQNFWSALLSGKNTTISHCSLMEGAWGGLYLGYGSSFNHIEYVSWRDNNYQQHKYYSDIAVDSSYGNLIENCTHEAPSGGDYHVAVKMFRNMGEGPGGIAHHLRETPPNDNIFRNNSIAGYSVGYEAAARMGEDIVYDLSGEGRDYASYNLFEDNSFFSTSVGIKVNVSGNSIRGNLFQNVIHPIVLHCVFYSLTETRIEDQDGTRVSFWEKNSDYTGSPDYAKWFSLQNDLNSDTDPSERYFHLSYSGAPAFDTFTGSSVLVKQTDNNTSQIINRSTMKDVYASGGTPVDIAIGNFWDSNPGDEIAIIWDAPVSRIAGTNYYSIIIYDTNGIEVNRCGKSTVPWRAIASGNFISLLGDEIAAVPETAVDGKYPIYVFARGREHASYTNIPNNTVKIHCLAGGDFNPSLRFDEIAYVSSSARTVIQHVKPSSDWTEETVSPSWILDVAAGDFDLTADGDEIAMIRNTRRALVYLFHPGDLTYYSTVGPNSGPTFGALAAGNFDGDATEEMAVALEDVVNGEYPIHCFNPGDSSAFKELSQNVLGVPAQAIAACDVTVGETLGVYERAQGFFSADYGATMSDWGKCIAVLPSAPQITAVPVFLLNAAPADNTDEYLKVVPIVR